ERGEDADYISFPDYAKLVGGRRRFPKKHFKGKNIVFIGAKDSYRVAALGMLGYGEFDPRQSVTNLDWTPSITVIGESSLTPEELDQLFAEQEVPDRFSIEEIDAKGVTKEVLCKRLRSRYLQLTGEYPRLDEERFSRVDPKIDTRSTRMERMPGGGIRFCYTDGNGDEFFIDNAMIIDCSGQEDATNLVLASLNEREVLSSGAIPQPIIDATLLKEGSVLVTSDSSRQRRDGRDVETIFVERVLNQKDETRNARVRVRVRHMDGNEKVGLAEIGPLANECTVLFGNRSFILRPASVSRVEASNIPPRVDQNDSSDPDEPSSQSPYGQALLGESIFFYGAADRLGIDEFEAQLFGKAFASVGENVKSLFRQILRVLRASRSLARRRGQQIERGSATAIPPATEFDTPDSPSIATGTRTTQTGSVKPRPNVAKSQLQPGEAPLMLKQMLGFAAEGLNFSGKQLEIGAEYDADSGEITYSFPSPADQAAAQALQIRLAEMFGNEAVQMAILQFCHKKKLLKMSASVRTGPGGTIDYPNAKLTLSRPQADPVLLADLIAKNRSGVDGTDA
ncbi:MAG TPA: hypothetical protein PKV72_06015, partial [Candidatus Peribacteria bacterium]|nr:hypothetical protein [Candidatus Peribacteria bacterium]